MKAAVFARALLWRRWWGEVALRAVGPGVLSGAEKRTFPALPAPTIAVWGEIAAVAIRAFYILRALVFWRTIILLGAFSARSFSARRFRALGLSSFVAVTMLALRSFSIGARCVFVVRLTFAGWRIRSLVVLCIERQGRKKDRDCSDDCVVHFHSWFCCSLRGAARWCSGC